MCGVCEGEREKGLPLCCALIDRAGMTPCCTEPGTAEEGDGVCVYEREKEGRENPSVWLSRGVS